MDPEETTAPIFPFDEAAAPVTAVEEDAASDTAVEEVDWSKLLQKKVAKKLHAKSRIEKIALVVSLILFLQLPLAPLLLFMFRSDEAKVKQLAGNFLRGRSDATPGDDTHFPAATLYSIWHERFKKCRDKLHKYIIEPCTFELVKAESDRGISSPDLKVKLGQLTMKDIREALNPGKLLRKYVDLFPFMNAILLAFCATSNRYRKYNMRGKPRTEDDDDDMPELIGIEDDGLEEDEIIPPGDEDEEWKDWRSDPRWAGFSRCPLHVRSSNTGLILYLT